MTGYVAVNYKLYGSRAWMWLTSCLMRAIEMCAILFLQVMVTFADHLSVFFAS